MQNNFYKEILHFAISFLKNWDITFKQKLCTQGGIRYGTDTMLKKYQGGGPLFILIPVSTKVLNGKQKGGSPERKFLTS